MDPTLQKYRSDPNEAGERRNCGTPPSWCSTWRSPPACRPRKAMPTGQPPATGGGKRDVPDQPGPCSSTRTSRKL
eukprot:11220346-Lingulodinium_polyedra.AAC.1